MEIHHYHGTAYHIFQGKETAQLDGHTGNPASENAWYWEPADYEGDVLYSHRYRDEKDAIEGAQEGDDDLWC